MAIDVRDLPDQSRYEILVDGAVAGFSEYRRSGDRITINHIEVDDAYEGQGLASVLARHMLDAAREAGLAVLPSCPYTAAWIKRHPEYVDLVPAGARATYDVA
jgi:uncharacterized protein